MKIREIMLGIALSGTAISALGLGAQQAFACSGKYCVDAETPTQMASAPVNSSTIRVSWVGHQDTQYQTVDVRVRQGGPTGAESVTQLPIHLGADYYQGHYPWSVDVPHLSFDTTYCFAVRTDGDKNAVSAWSEQTCAQTPYPPFATGGAAPAPATGGAVNLSATAANATAVLSWTYQNSDGQPNSFTVLRNGTIIGAAAGAATSYTDAGPLTAGQSYAYQVCARYGSGDTAEDLHCSSSVSATAGSAQPATPPAAAATWPTVRSGAQGETVRTIQSLLQAQGSDVTVDGDFGPQTQAAVESFQASNGLTQDGVVGPLTWAKLIVTVQSGSQGPAVEALQSQLNAHSANVAVDGDFGPQTDAAVRAFQQAHGLTVDGIVGPQTWQALVAVQ